MGYIYKITNTINGKAYIGQTILDPVAGRIHDHFNYPDRSNVYLSNAIKKYGRDAFTVEILHEALNIFLDDLEVAEIKKHNTFAPNGYNLTHGGSGSLLLPEYGGDKNKRQNAWRKKRYATDPEYREKERNRGRELYAKNKEKQQERGRKYYHENKASIKSKLKKRRATDPDFRQKQRDALKKYKSKPEVREQQKAYFRDRYANNPEVRERQNRLRNERYANDPEYREKRKQKSREYYEKRKHQKPPHNQ